MADADDFAQLMQHLQSAGSTPGSASLPEGASSSTPTSSSNGLLPNGKKTKGRVKIKMEYINNKLRRYTTFSKRKTGIMKKAFELSTLTGTQVMLLVASETGHVYTYATKKLQPMISSDAGKALIQTCLNAPAEGSDLAPSRTEFTFDSGNGMTSMRKRKMMDSSPIDTHSVPFPQFLPTMVPLFQPPFDEEAYNSGDDSGDDSDSEEAASDIKEEDQGSPSMVVKKEEPDEKPPPQSLFVLREALKAAGTHRIQQQKRAKTQPSQVPNPASKASFVAPFLLQGLTATSTNNGTVFNLPQGTVYTSVASNGGANASSVFNSAAKAADDASAINQLFSFPLNFQQLLESANLGG